MDIDNYIISGSPTGWLEYAEELHLSAESLWYNERKSKRIILDLFDSKDETEIPIISRTYFLLSALSIENLIKGLLIADNPNLLENGKLSTEITSHNLEMLIKKIENIKISSVDSTLLQIGTSAILSWGRYPITKSFSSPIHKDTLTNDYRNNYKKLYIRLSKRLYNRLKNGWSGPNSINVSGIHYSRYEKLPKEWKDKSIDEILEGCKQIQLVPRRPHKNKK